jgi:hemerythrin-like metal-binding protein
MIDELRSTVSSGNYEAIEIQLTALLESMERHFDHEEDFMREHEYPDLRCHASVHAEFLQEGIDLLSRIVARTGLINAGFCDRLNNRLEDHVDVHDRKYVKYCLAAAAVAHSRQE